MGNYRKRHISRHRTGWRYKRAVPRELQGLIGRKEWSEYFGSIGERVAETKARELAVEHDRLVGQLRTLTPAERDVIAARGGLQPFRQYLEGTVIGTAFVDYFAAKEPDPNSPERQQQEDALEIMRARRQAAEMRAEAAAGRKTLAKANGKGVGIEALVPIWQRVSKPRASASIRSMQYCAGRFVEIVGDVEPKAVTRTHIIKFRDALEANTKISRRTAAKYLEMIHRLLNVALSAGIVTYNPAHGVKLSKADGKLVDQQRKQPFQPSHVQAIFAAMPSESEDFQWMMRLLAYHGMRGGEAVQLRADDVTDMFGVPVLRIHDRHGTIKNKHSVRDIPIHPACMGIVEYAQAVPGPWLFSSFPEWGDRRAAGFQRQASDFLRKRVKILDRGLTMHSFRHLWRTLAREINMPDAVSRSIMGHALGRDDHAAYGDGPSLKVRAEWMAKIDPLD